MITYQRQFIAFNARRIWLVLVVDMASSFYTNVEDWPQRKEHVSREQYPAETKTN